MGEIYLYTGTGAGKTTNALGMALRFLGHKRKVFVVQFMKGRKDIGEFKVKEECNLANYEIYQFGNEGFVNLKSPSESDRTLAREGLEFADKLLERKPDLLVLDELNLAAGVRLIDAKSVIDFLEKAKNVCDVAITGRHAPHEIINLSDYVTLITLIKMPKETKAKKGINY